MPTSLTIGPYVVGERPAPLEYQFLDSAGAPMDLTGYSAEFHVQPRNGTAVVHPAAVTDPATGRVTHTWSGTELVTSGTWWMEFWVGNGTNRFCSLRLEATVRVPVGTAPTI